MTFEEFWENVTDDLQHAQWTIERAKIVAEGAWNTGKLEERQRIAHCLVNAEPKV